MHNLDVSVKNWQQTCNQFYSVRFLMVIEISAVGKGNIVKTVKTETPSDTFYFLNLYS